MFSKDEMRRAIEDALKSMEGVALELYRRGREEAREEIAEANARRGDLRTALQWANEERDEARADLREFVRQAENAYALLKPIEDGSDAVEHAVGHLLTVLRGRERPGPWAFDVVLRERDEARAEVERLRAAVHTRACRNQSAYNLNCVCGADERQRDLQKLAYRRGAEAMREAIASACISSVGDAIRALPIPEEP